MMPNAHDLRRPVNTACGIQHVISQHASLCGSYTTSYESPIETVSMADCILRESKRRFLHQGVSFRRGLWIEIVFRIALATVDSYRNDYNVVCSREQTNVYVRRQDKSVGFFCCIFLSHTNSKQMYRHNNVRVIQRIEAMRLIKKYRTFSQRESLYMDVFNQCLVSVQVRSPLVSPSKYE
jgi:hypothetical protein